MPRESRAIDTPGIRDAASAAFGSGKLPIWSAETTLVMLSAVRCMFSACAWPSAIGVAVAATSTVSVKVDRLSVAFTVSVWPADTVTDARSSA